MDHALDRPDLVLGQRVEREVGREEPPEPPDRLAVPGPLQRRQLVAAEHALGREDGREPGLVELGPRDVGEQDAVAAGEAELALVLAVGVAEDGELGAAQLVHQAEEVLADLADRVLVPLDVLLAALGLEQLDVLVGDADELPGIPALDLQDEQAERVGQQGEVGIPALDHRLVPGDEVVGQEVAEQAVGPLLPGGGAARGRSRGS